MFSIFLSVCLFVALLIGVINVSICLSIWEFLFWEYSEISWDFFALIKTTVLKFQLSADHTGHVRYWFDSSFPTSPNNSANIFIEPFIYFRFKT